MLLLLSIFHWGAFYPEHKREWLTKAFLCKEAAAREAEEGAFVKFTFPLFKWRPDDKTWLELSRFLSWGSMPLLPFNYLYPLKELFSSLISYSLASKKDGCSRQDNFRLLCLLLRLCPLLSVYWWWRTLSCYCCCSASLRVEYSLNSAHKFNHSPSFTVQSKREGSLSILFVCRHFWI